MTSLYLNSTDMPARSHSHYPVITRDDMLAAARKFDRYMRLSSPRPYRLRICDDGSLHGYETTRWSIGYLSLEEVNIAVHEMYGRDRSIPLWQKLTTLLW